MLIKMKCIYIKDLLIPTKLLRDDVARKAGFYSAQALHLFFKRETKMTPGA
jgi:AraC-like DNA-binding protein